MRNVTFQEVGMENYGPYIDPMVLTFHNNKLTLITGPNGIGKTMSLEAIPFTFYGITSKGARGDDVVNNKVGKNCKTWVKFTVNDDQYIVIRYHKYTKYQNTVIVNQNGVDIKQGHREVLPFIERIVCPQQAFMNALMFGQKVKDFFTDIVDSKKKEIFRKILDLEMFTIYYKFSDKALKDVELQILDLNGDINVKAGLLEDTIQQIELLTKLKNNFYNDREQKIKDKSQDCANCNRILSKWEEDLNKLSQKDVDLETTIIELATIEKQIEDIGIEDKQKFQDLENKKHTKFAEITAKAQEARTEISEKYNTELSNIQQKKIEMKDTHINTVNKLKDQKHNLEIKYAHYSSEIKFFKNRVKEIKTNLIDSQVPECPLCEQSIDKHTTKVLESKIKDYNEEILYIREKKGMTQDSISNIDKNLSEANLRFSGILQHIDIEKNSVERAKQDELEQVTNKLQEATLRVTKMAEQLADKLANEIHEKSKSLISQKTKLIIIRTEQEKNIKDIQKIEDNIKQVKQDITQLQKDISHLEEDEYDETQLNSYLTKEVQYNQEIEIRKKKVKKLASILDIIKFWKIGFSPSGIPSMLIDEAIPYMNERVEHYLEVLTAGRYIVSFDTLAETKAGDFRDKISVHILDTKTMANSRVQLSGGQTRIIDIATILTLGDLLSKIQDIKFNILLFDEIFDALDEQNIQYVSKVLSKLKIGKSIYIISHQHQDHLEADETLSFI